MALLVQDRVDGWVKATADLVSMHVQPGKANNNRDCSPVGSGPVHTEIMVPKEVTKQIGGRKEMLRR